MAPQTILVPIEFPDPDPLPSTFVDVTTSCKVVLLGLYELPEDVTEDERQRREIEANEVLYSLASSFVREGETAEVELVTGRDLGETATAVAEERDVDAVLHPNPMTTLGRVLVPIRDERFAEPVVDLLTTLNQERLLHTTLLYVAGDESETDAGEDLLDEARERLVEAGHPSTGIDAEVVVSDDPTFAISQAATGNDLIVMGETQDDKFESVFGKTYENVADQTEIPIIVVRTND